MSENGCFNRLSIVRVFYFINHILFHIIDNEFIHSFILNFFLQLLPAFLLSLSLSISLSLLLFPWSWHWLLIACFTLLCYDILGIGYWVLVLVGNRSVNLCRLFDLSIEKKREREQAIICMWTLNFELRAKSKCCSFVLALAFTMLTSSSSSSSSSSTEVREQRASNAKLVRVGWTNKSSV